MKGAISTENASDLYLEKEKNNTISMSVKTIWEWLCSNGWPCSMNRRISMTFFHNDLRQPSRIFTHEEVSKVANEICERIVNFNIHEQLIVIDSEETCLTIPFILGILRSNNSFFLCNSNWPEDMLRNYITQLNPSLFICQRQTEKKIYEQIFEHATRSSVVLLDEPVDFYRTSSQCSYKEIAYVIASSGSTGVPKLIFVSHACLLPNLNQLKSLFNVTADDCLFRSTPLTFDPSLIDIFLAVHCGARLCLFSKEIRQNPISVSTVFDHSQCTIAQMTPSFFRQINTHCNIMQLKTLVLGGEPFPSVSNATIQQLVRQNRRVINIYGLTEMSCWASSYILNANDLRTEAIPLGQALDQTSLILQPYLDDTSRTDCFQVILESQTRWTHIGDVSSERRFRFETDDLVRYDQQTNEIFYVGRRTLTLKRFGIMISLEYIEQVARQSAMLDECACLFSNEDVNFLILLCKFRSENQVNDLNAYLKSHLSHHFLPNLILPIHTSIPLSVNGKIDRSKLYPLYLATNRTDVNNDLAHIWQKILNKRPANDANFIADGGNSLLALILIEQIKQVYSSVDSNHLFDLILHKPFQELLEYLHHPQQPTIAESFLSAIPTDVISRSISHSIRSIQRCSKAFLHNDENSDRMSLHPSLPDEVTFPTASLALHWKCSMKKCIDASPLIVLLDDQRHYVIIGSHAGLVNAYQIDQGQLMWSWQANDRVEASAALSRDGQFVLVGDYSGTLYVIDCSNGKLYSTYQCQGLIKTIPCIHSSLDLVYLGAHDHFIHAIHLQESASTCVWKFGLNSSCVSSPQLSADNQRLYVASLGGDVVALQSSDAHVFWKQPLGKPIFSTMAVWKEKFLFIGCVDQKLYCLSCDTGEQKWTFATDGPIFSSPCLFDDTLYIGCHDQNLYAIDLSVEQHGTLRWKHSFPSMIYASPFVYDHGRMLVAGSTNGCLRVLRSQTGETICETEVDGEGLFSSPVCYRDYVMVGSRDDHLYCYRMQPQ